MMFVCQYTLTSTLLWTQLNNALHHLPHLCWCLSYQTDPVGHKCHLLCCHSTAPVLGILQPHSEHLGPLLLVLWSTVTGQVRCAQPMAHTPYMWDLHPAKPQAQLGTGVHLPPTPQLGHWTAQGTSLETAPHHFCTAVTCVTSAVCYKTLGTSTLVLTPLWKQGTDKEWLCSHVKSTSLHFCI